MGIETGPLRPADLPVDRGTAERNRDQARQVIGAAGSELGEMYEAAQQRGQRDALLGVGIGIGTVTGVGTLAGGIVARSGGARAILSGAGKGALIGAAAGSLVMIVALAGAGSTAGSGRLTAEERERAGELRTQQWEASRALKTADRALMLHDGRTSVAGNGLGRINELGEQLLRFDHDGSGAVNLAPDQPLDSDELVADRDGGPVTDPRRTISRLHPGVAKADTNGDGQLTRHELESYLAERFIEDGELPSGVHETAWKRFDWR
jgi:hypothetical protein